MRAKIVLAFPVTVDSIEEARELADEVRDAVSDEFNRVLGEHGVGWDEAPARLPRVTVEIVD